MRNADGGVLLRQQMVWLTSASRAGFLELIWEEIRDLLSRTNKIVSAVLRVSRQ